MISVIVYGRNDSYGYNLAKRAAISINCIAQVLDAEGDEIIFVDCNTPNDIPTFPESIADTLTERAKSLLRVLRLRPDQYERGKNGSKFKVLEPLCRNIAIRRSNPANRWILNTNTDMVFTPLRENLSLSRIVSELPDGFYELPRFEVPESLWESVNRLDPEEIIRSFKQWGLRLHLDEVLTASKELLFDGPGDFQLTLRSQLFQIHGMNEQMVSGWHVDINLGRRMWLLNGATRTILHELHAFHCDHTRIQTVYHMAGTSTANSIDDFFTNVETPFIPTQAENWGMPDEQIEEIHLNAHHTLRIQQALERLLPGMQTPIADYVVGCNFNDTRLYYDNLHAFPYLADIVTHMPPKANIGYLGNNTGMLRLLSDYRAIIGQSGKISYHRELLASFPPNNGNIPTEQTIPNLGEELFRTADLLVIDFSMINLPSRLVDGLKIPSISRDVELFARAFEQEITALATQEYTLIKEGRLPRHFIFIGCHGTSFDTLVLSLFSCALTPPSTCIRSGTLKPEALEKCRVRMPFHSYVIGQTYKDYANWIAEVIGRPVCQESYTETNELYNTFTTNQDPAKAYNAFEKLMSTDVGRGRMLLQIRIAEINEMYEQAKALKDFIGNYNSGQIMNLLDSRSSTRSPKIEETQH